MAIFILDLNSLDEAIPIVQLIISKNKDKKSVYKASLVLKTSVDLHNMFT